MRADIQREEISQIQGATELEKMISQLRRGDTVVVWKLGRLGRSLRDLIALVADFKERRVEFVSLQDGVNTPTDRFIFKIFASLAEIEREINRERTIAGLAAAKARGKKGGRPAGLSKPAMEKAKSARKLFDSRTKIVEEIAKYWASAGPPATAVSKA